MACHYLAEFNRFQLHILITEAKEAHKDPEVIAQGWIDANSQTIREVFCESICPDKEICKESPHRKEAKESQKTTSKP